MQTDTCLIPLSQGQFAIVDSIDYDWLSQWKWNAAKYQRSYGFTWYAVRTIHKPKNVTVQMHQEIAKRAGIPPSRQYDHRDRNGLNNTRGNIRPSNHQLNMANSKKSVGKSSKHKGVIWNKARKKWHAQIGFNGDNIYLGLFDNEDDAGEAYVVAAIQLFGEFAFGGDSPVPTG